MPSGGCTTPTYAKVLFSFQYKTSIAFLKHLQETGWKFILLNRLKLKFIMRNFPEKAINYTLNRQFK